MSEFCHYSSSTCIFWSYLLLRKILQIVARKLRPHLDRLPQCPIVERTHTLARSPSLSSLSKGQVLLVDRPLSSKTTAHSVRNVKSRNKVVGERVDAEWNNQRTWEDGSYCSHRQTQRARHMLYNIHFCIAQAAPTPVPSDSGKYT